MASGAPPSPRQSGSTTAPLSKATARALSSSSKAHPQSGASSSHRGSLFLIGQLPSTSAVTAATANMDGGHMSPSSSSNCSVQSPPMATRRRRSSGDRQEMTTPVNHGLSSASSPSPLLSTRARKKFMLVDPVAKAQSRSARKLNDSLVYLDGPQIYTCAQCRTHLTTHDEIISKSFHGRHGRAYLFDHCVNVSIGPPQDRSLMTGLHSVSDIFCKRCQNMVGWTYIKAYEMSQKYKEGKFIVEKINLHLEESDYYDVAHPAGERKHRFRERSISWGSESLKSDHGPSTVYEYEPLSPINSVSSRR